MSGSSRVKSYSQLEQEIRSLEEQSAFYYTELQEAVRVERHRACLIVKDWCFDSCIAEDICNKIVGDEQ